MARGPKLKMGEGWFKYIVLKTWKPGFQMFYDADKYRIQSLWATKVCWQLKK